MEYHSGRDVSSRMRKRETKTSTDRKQTVAVCFELGHVEDIMDVHIAV